VIVSVETALPVPVARAWAALLDWERQADWMRDADSVRVLSENREGVGVWLAVRTRILNVQMFTEVLEVIEWEPPSRLVMAHRSFVRGTGEWLLEPDAVGSRWRWTERLSLPPAILGELALRVYQPFMRHLMRTASRGFRESLAS
jgi:uncharacterized protein YndB with AHSA1/START domain